MRIIVRAPVVFQFNSVWPGVAVRLLLAFWRALLLAAFLYVVIEYPRRRFGPLEQSLKLLATCLEVPVFLLGRVLRPFHSPVSIIRPFYYTGMGVIDPISTLRAHMRAATLTYFLILGAPTFFSLGKEWLARHRGAAPRA